MSVIAALNSWQEILDLKDDVLHDRQLALNFNAEEIELSGLVWLSGLTANDAAADQLVHIWLVSGANTLNAFKRRRSAICDGKRG